MIHRVFLNTLPRVGTVEVTGHGIISGHSRSSILFDWQLIVLPHKRGSVLRLLSMK